MSYIKAQQVFPEPLLKEIQKYVQGELIYIPKPQANYKKWGERTGAKNIVAVRNKNIIQAFKEGSSISQLAELYSLAEDTIKKIVYVKH